MAIWEHKPRSILSASSSVTPLKGNGKGLGRGKLGTGGTLNPGSGRGRPSSPSGGESTIIIPGDGTTIWQNVNGMTTGEGTADYLSGSNWAARAAFGSLPAGADGAFEVTASGDEDISFGLHTSITNTSTPATLVWNMYASSAGTLFFRRLASTKYTSSTGYADPGDVYRMERVGTSISLYKNGLLLHSESGIAETGELFCHVKSFSAVVAGSYSDVSLTIL